jgi:GNAT superfamily N-acetyltransferase
VSATEIAAGFQLIRDLTPQQIDEVCRLRLEAWRGQARLKPNVTEWRDEWDADAHHVAAIDTQGRIAGGFRLTLHTLPTDSDHLPDEGVWAAAATPLPQPVAYMCRLFVSPDYRGRGLARALDQAAFLEPPRHGARAGVALTGSVVSNRARAETMERYGWQTSGEAKRVPNTSVFFADFAPLVLSFVVGEKAQ